MSSDITVTLTLRYYYTSELFWFKISYYLKGLKLQLYDSLLDLKIRNLLIFISNLLLP